MEERIFAGNLMGWEPPRRFDFVRTELEYVQPGRRREMVERLLSDFLVPGGRLIVCSYGSSRPHQPGAGPVGEILRAWGHEVTGETKAADPNGAVISRVAWTNAPHPPANP